MGKKIYKIGDEYSIGVFDDKTGEQLKGGSPKYYKSKKNAERILKKLLEE